MNLDTVSIEIYKKGRTADVFFYACPLGAVYVDGVLYEISSSPCNIILPSDEATVTVLKTSYGVDPPYMIDDRYDSNAISVTYNLSGVLDDVYTTCNGVQDMVYVADGYIDRRYDLGGGILYITGTLSKGKVISLITTADKKFYVSDDVDELEFNSSVNFSGLYFNVIKSPIFNEQNYQHISWSPPTTLTSKNFDFGENSFVCREIKSDQIVFAAEDIQTYFYNSLFDINLSYTTDPKKLKIEINSVSMDTYNIFTNYSPSENAFVNEIFKVPSFTGVSSGVHQIAVPKIPAGTLKVKVQPISPTGYTNMPVNVYTLDIKDISENYIGKIEYISAEQVTNTTFKVYYSYTPPTTGTGGSIIFKTIAEGAEYLESDDAGALSTFGAWTFNVPLEAQYNEAPLELSSSLMINVDGIDYTSESNILILVLEYTTFSVDDIKIRHT